MDFPLRERSNRWGENICHTFQTKDYHRIYKERLQGKINGNVSKRQFPEEIWLTPKGIGEIQSRKIYFPLSHWQRLKKKKTKT